MVKYFIFLLSFVLMVNINFASSVVSENGTKKKEFNLVESVMHHISDSHDWHFFGENKNSFSLPLPIILYTNNQLICFLSSEFHHDDKGKIIVSKKGLNIVNIHENIYVLNTEETEVKFDKSHHIINAYSPLDFSITKNVLTLFVVALLVFIVFLSVSKFYRKNGLVAPKGIAKFFEPIILFVKEDIALVNIRKDKHEKFMPFLLTAFFFIWFSNLLGMIPFFPGGANLTGNIAVTFVLAIFTFIITNLNGNKNYWTHILWMPNTPFFVKLILTPIEIIGILSKPFALMIRLFANITAGHIIVLSLISLIFVFKHIATTTVLVPFALFISALELLVAFLQAYVFTMLSALFIGTAVAEEHH